MSWPRSRIGRPSRRAYSDPPPPPHDFVPGREDAYLRDADGSPLQFCGRCGQKRECGNHMAAAEAVRNQPAQRSGT